MKDHRWLYLAFLVLFLMLWGAPFAFAGSGMVSPKDQCHWDRKVDPPERHWHNIVNGKKVRGGPCLEFFGKTIKFGVNAICAKERAGLHHRVKNHLRGNDPDRALRRPQGDPLPQELSPAV